MFIVLYPIGIGSEWWLMYNATTVTTNWAVAGIFYFFLALYVPGKYQKIFYAWFAKLKDHRIGNDVFVYAEAETKGLSPQRAKEGLIFAGSNRRRSGY